MKHTTSHHGSLLVNAVLASSLFCALPNCAQAFVDIPATTTTDTTATPDGGQGYNFTGTGSTLTVNTNAVIGQTGGISLDDNNGNADSPFGETIIFQGNATIQGDIGTSNPITVLNATGYGNTILFQGPNLNFTNLNYASGAGNDIIFPNGVNATGAINNSSGNEANLSLVGNGTLGGNLSQLTLIELNTANGANKTITFTGQNIAVSKININDDKSSNPLQGTTLVLNKDSMALTGNITALTNNEDILNVINATSITGNIGTAASALNLIKVAANQNLSITGNIFATETQFQGGYDLTLGNGSVVTGNVTTTANGNGNLIFAGNSEVTGTIGTNAKQLNAVVLTGPANSTVNFSDKIYVQNSLQFADPATATTNASFDNNVTVFGNIENTTGSSNAGTLIFLGDATLQGTIGITPLSLSKDQSLASILIQGADSTVNLTKNVSLTGSITFAPDSDLTTTLNLADGITITGGIDNTTTTTTGLGIVNFLGSGTLANYATTNATANIGETHPINILNINSNATANALVTLQGAIINANSIFINDNGTPTTLRLDNSNMVLTGNITAKSNLDILDIFNANSVTGNVGNSTTGLGLVKVGANGNTTFNGNLYATLTQFQADNLFTLADNSIIHGNVDTTALNQGTLVFAGNGTVTGNTGATNKIKSLTLEGSGSLADFQGSVKTGILNFAPNSNSSTTALFEKGVTLDSIDNTTGTDGAGTVMFLNNGTINATVGAGANHKINILNLQGAGNTVNFIGTVNANGITFSNTANSLTTANLQQDIIITSIDSLTSTDVGTVKFGGNGTITANVGETFALHDIELQGAGKLVEFQGTAQTNNLNFSGAANATTQAKFDTTATLGAIDNLTGANGNGTLTFLSNATITGNVGATNSLNIINLNGAGSTVDFQQAVKSNFIYFNLPATSGTTAKFDGNVTLGIVDNKTGTNGNGTLTFLGNGASVISGTVGATNSLNAINLQGPGGSVEFQSTVNSNNLGFSGAANTTTTAQFDANVTLGGITNATGSSAGTLTFLNNATINGNVGGTPNAISTINLKGAGTTVAFNGTTTADNLIFTGGASNTTTTKFAQTATLGNIDATTNGWGIVTFLSNGTVSGTVGATKQVNLINLQGANQTVNFQQNLNIGTLAFSGTANPSTTATFNNNVSLTGAIDNTTGASGNGTITFLGNATVNGTIGATKSLNAINLQGANQTVNFFGNVLNNTPINLQTNAIASLGNNVTVGPVDNTSGSLNTGTLQLVGNGAVTGSIGATNPLNLISINSGLGPNKAATLSGNIVRAANIAVNDDGATTTTLTLNNAAMVLTGNIIPLTTQIDNLTIQRAAIINGNLGSATNNFNLVTVAQNSSTTLNGNIFATTTQFAGNNSLTLGNNNYINGPVVTTAINQGQLNFAGNSTIDYLIGGPGLPLGAININGGANSTVTLNNNVYAATTKINNGGTLALTGSNTLNGNLIVSNGTLSLGAHANPATVTGTVNLTNNAILNVDLGNGFSAGSLVANGAVTIDPAAKLTLTHIPFNLANGDTVLTLVTGGPGSAIAAIPASSSSILFNFSTIANAQHLKLVIDVTSPSDFTNSGNTNGIGTALGQINGATTYGLLNQIFQQLPFFTSAEQLEKALAALAPNVDRATVDGSFDLQQHTFALATEHLNEIYLGKIRARHPLRQRGFNSGDDDVGFGTWIKMFGQYSDQKERQGIEGYRNKMWGLSAGFDFLATDYSVAGFSLSWANANIDNLVSGGSHTDIDSYQAALYGQHTFECPYYLNWQLGLGHNKYDAERNVAFGTLFFTPQSIYHSWQYSAQLDSGYVYNSHDDFYLIPMASLHYSHLTFNRYTETGAGSASQRVEATEYNKLLAGAGLKITTDYPYLNVLIQPEAHAMAYYDVIKSNVETSSQFVSAGPYFVTKGMVPARDSYNVGLSLTAFNKAQGLNISASYDYTFREDFNSHAGFIKVHYGW